jgi:hypothetical protein
MLLANLLSVTHAFAFDPRASQMNKVLVKYNSPLAGHEDKLIEIAEKYDLDWTLMAAIAGTESSFARRMPANCINPYGWGIYGANRLCFNSLDQAIEEVGRGLGTKYNTNSIETIARTYNTVSTQGWITHTRYFMNKIKNADVSVAELPITI